jgi:hypothetical protein
VADLPDGVEMAHTHWGEPKSDTSLQGLHLNVSPSPFGVPYAYAIEEDRTKKCRANADTCNGWRMKDGDFCPAHAGVMKPHGAAEEDDDG